MKKPVTEEVESRDLVIQQLDRAQTALATARTIPDAKRFVDIGATAKTWARQQGLSDEIKAHAHAFYVDALAHLGKMLKVSDRNKGTRGQLRGKQPSGGTKVEPPEDSTPTIEELDLDKKTSSLAQKLASLPTEQFEAVRTGASTVTKAIREVIHAQRPQVVAPIGKYRVIYADPPWSYGNSGLQQYGHASHHYPSMSIEELCALPIADLGEDDAVLFMWVTSPLLEESFAVINAWGFNYKTSFVWDKVKHNFGHYNSVRHELLLVCTRGSCTPDVKTLYDSVQTIERSEKHSDKPEEFRAIIDALYTHGKRIELFNRATYEGWETWGNEPGKS